jgi:hypothetical protein
MHNACVHQHAYSSPRDAQPCHVYQIPDMLQERLTQQRKPRSCRSICGSHLHPHTISQMLFLRIRKTTASSTESPFVTFCTWVSESTLFAFVWSHAVPCEVHVSPGHAKTTSRHSFHLKIPKTHKTYASNSHPYRRDQCARSKQRSSDAAQRVFCHLIPHLANFLSRIDNGRLNCPQGLDKLLSVVH